MKTRCLSFSMAVAGLLATAASAAAQRGYELAVASSPPAAVNPQDPADSLYREARSALNRANYSRAAYLFAQVHERHPRSSYTADAYYWEAFARYRSGSTANLTAALNLLQQQGERHPRAATRRDAEALASRIRGQLARRGDAEAAREVEELARELADVNRQAADRGREARERARAADKQAQARCEGEDDERMSALNALLQMDGDRALPILKKVMARRDEGSVCLRRKAMFLISQHEGPEAEALLLEAARSDPDLEVREQGVFWLSQVESEGAVAALDSILRSSPDRPMQEKAIFALSQHRSPVAMKSLRDFVQRQGAPADLREKAIFWLGQNDRGENAQFLRTLFRTVQEPGLKEKILFSVAQHGDGESRRWLLEVAGAANEDLEVRKKAVFWAVQGGEDVPELYALYDRTTDREMKEQLIFAYSQRRGKAAADKLIQIAREDRDRELRKKAIFWLSQSDDPRVAKLLEEILEKP